MRRVVITGMGVASPIGLEIEEFFNNIKNGVHGFSKIEHFDTSDFDVKVSGYINNFDPLKHFEKKELRRTDRFTQFAVAASNDAIEDCGTKFEDLDPYKVGVIIGSGIGGIEGLENEHDVYREKGHKRVSVFTIPMIITNMGTGTVAMRLGYKGINYSPVTACASSTHAIGEAFRNIKHGYLDACVTGGAEATITKFCMSGFNNMKALSHSEDVDRASIPFDKERNGFVMSEGGAVLVLEEYEHAKARGAKIYAEVVGYGATADAHHITSPDPEGAGAAKAMQLAFEEAGITGDKIDYINAHGTSTGLNDKYETIAVKKAFGEHVNKLAISSSKSMTGHMLGAAGAVEAIVCAKALQEGVIPATIGFKEADEDCDLDYVTDGTRKKDIKYAISNSLGFGGHNASLCFKKD